MFNLGITVIGYECFEHIHRTLSPWIQLKKNGLPGLENIFISVGHGCFEETASLGYPIFSTDGTIEEFKKLKENGDIDSLFVYTTPQKEYDMWTNNYEFLKKQNINLLLLLSIDEIWSIEEITRTLKFIEMNEFVDYFKVNFKNYCINEKTWVNDFIVPRIWYVNRHSGLKGFYKDDLVEYNDQTKDFQCSHVTIPVNITFPRHLSWVGSKEYLQRKIKFQQIRYGTCSYVWDDNSNQLILNENYYKVSNKAKPILNYETN